MATMELENDLPMSIPLTYEMLDGTSRTMDFRAANVPTSNNGRKVSSGSLRWADTEPNERGWFKVGSDNELTVILPHSGPFAVFFDEEVCAKLFDKKGLYTADCFAIVPGMKCFVENTGQDRQFSVLAVASKQGKELGLDPADEDANVFTLYTYILEPREEEATRGITRGITRDITKSVTGSCGPTRGATRSAPTQSTKTYNVAAGFGEKTGTTWTTSTRLSASKTLTTQFRIKVLQRNTEKPVSFTQKFRAGAFEADPVSGESGAEAEDGAEK